MRKKEPIFFVSIQNANSSRTRTHDDGEMSAGGTRAHARNASILKLPRDVVRKVASFLGTREVAGWSCVDKETHAALRGRLADVAALLATFGSLRVDELDGGCCFFTDAEHRPTTDDEAHAGDDAAGDGAAGDGAAGDGAMYDEAAWVLARHAKQGALVHVRDLALVRARVSATTARSLGRVLHSDTMPHLRALKLADLQWRACAVCDLTTTWARAACAWPNLLELQLQGLRLTGQGLVALLDAAGLPELLRLSLDDNPRLTSDAAGCAAVARALALPRLESIRLQNVGLDDARVVDVLEKHASLLAPRATGGASRVSSLRSFDARGNARFGDGALVALAARTDDGGTLHALQSLVLAQTRVGDAGVVALTATCRARGTPSPLERIDLAFARAGVGAMRALATTLRSGDLPCCRSIVLAGAHAPPRAELRDLRVAMGTNWLRKLFVPQQLPRYSVDLSRVAWHDGDVARFAATVQHTAERFARVTALSLAHNEFGATGMRALALAADAMGGHAALRVLDLRGNVSLGDAGVVVLAESLLSGAWPGLEKLHLGGIHLECPGDGQPLRRHRQRGVAAPPGRAQPLRQPGGRPRCRAAGGGRCAPRRAAELADPQPARQRRRRRRSGGARARAAPPQFERRTASVAADAAFAAAQLPDRGGRGSARSPRRCGAREATGCRGCRRCSATSRRSLRGICRRGARGVA